MTEPRTPDSRDDDVPEVDAAFELASALHDGEASDVERARAGADTQAALRSVSAVAREVAAVPPPPVVLVDDHVAAALAAFDEDDAPAGGAGEVVPLGRRPWWQQAPLGAVAAAVAVVALVVGIGAAALSGDDTSDDTATAALDTADDAGDEGAAEESAEAFGADDGAAGGSAATRPAYAGYDELAADVSALLEAGTSATTAASADAAETEESALPPDQGGTERTADCDAIGTAGIDPGAVRLVWTAVVDGTDVTAVVHGEDPARLTVVDDATCAVVDERDL